MPRSRLLVSVRNADEADEALAGGADLIDVKEPSRGAIGRADAHVIASVLRKVRRCAPVSAALGELGEFRLDIIRKLPGGITYIKWGLAGQLKGRWSIDLRLIACIVQCKFVVVAYADWLRAEAPPVVEVLREFKKSDWTTLLLDTFQKDGSTLLDYLTKDQIAKLVQEIHAANKTVALAGSLGMAEIEQLRCTEPDWFAVRGAACIGGRNGYVDAERVRNLKLGLSVPC